LRRRCCAAAANNGMLMLKRTLKEFRVPIQKDR
jgi:hypothetical protein